MIATHPAPTPFWSLKNIPVDVSLSYIIDKKTTTIGAMKKITSQHMTKEYNNYNKVYTDASKLDTRVGIGIFEEKSDMKQAYRVNDHLSITSGELAAIKKVFENTLHNPNLDKTPICICTDSLGACQAILSGDVKEVARPGILTDIHLLHENMINIGLTTQIVWIPSHIDITGNEIADRWANKGRLKETVDYNQKLGYSEIVSLVNNKINNKVYQKDYSTNTHQSVIKFRKSFPDIKCKIKLDKELYLLNRLRANATRINLLNEDIYCRVCRTHLNSKHAIKHCKLFEKERNAVVKSLRDEHLDFKIKNIIKPNLKTSSNTVIMTLLKKLIQSLIYN